MVPFLAATSGEATSCPTDPHDSSAISTGSEQPVTHSNTNEKRLASRCFMRTDLLGWTGRISLELRFDQVLLQRLGAGLGYPSPKPLVAGLDMRARRLC